MACSELDGLEKLSLNACPAESPPEKQSCSICMDGEVSKPTRIQGCNHLFWYDTVVQLTRVYAAGPMQPEGIVHERRRVRSTLDMPTPGTSPECLRFVRRTRT